MATLGARILEARKAAGLTRTQLACELGKGEQAVYYYERDRSQPTFDTLRQIANATGKPVSWFVDDQPAAETDVGQPSQPMLPEVGKLPEGVQQ